MNPLNHQIAPLDLLAPRCPLCDATPALRTRLVFSSPHVRHRMACKRCRTRTDEFTTWVGAVAAWDRREVRPRVGS